jgi:hypothetical protein
MWKKYIKEVISELNDIQQLPSSGILAGGAIANKIWEKVSGNKAIINDIDIFIFKSIKSVNDADINNEETKNEHYTKSIEDDLSINTYHDGYHLYLNYCTTTKSYYRILDTERLNEINTIFIESNDEDPNIVIGSFDLNCTQVAYDLATGELYYTEDFDKFIRTGVIAIVNINTPSHTLLRMLSKRDVLNANVDMEREVSYIMQLHKNHIKKNIRFNFSEKYLPIFKKYKNEIKELGFSIEKQEVKYNPKLPSVIYRINPIATTFPFLCEIQERVTKYDTLEDVPYIKHIHALNFYYKFIYGNEDLKTTWEDLGLFWSIGKHYTTAKELELFKPTIKILSKLCEKHILIKKALYGLTLKEQIKIIDLLSEYIKDKDKDYVNDILSVSDSKMLFETIEDVEDHFTLMHIKHRAFINRMVNSREANQKEIVLPF